MATSRVHHFLPGIILIENILHDVLPLLQCLLGRRLGWFLAAQTRMFLRLHYTHFPAR